MDHMVIGLGMVCLCLALFMAMCRDILDAKRKTKLYAFIARSWCVAGVLVILLSGLAEFWKTVVTEYIVGKALTVTAPAPVMTYVAPVPYTSKRPLLGDGYFWNDVEPIGPPIEMDEAK